MGLKGVIGKLLSFSFAIRNSVKVGDAKLDPGGGPNVTAEHFAPPGDDSHPLPGDYVYAGTTPQQGRRSALGYIDPVNDAQAAPGEKRIYARDAGTGAVVCEIWLKNDGTALIANDNGSVTLSPDGSILGQNGAGQFELEVGGDFVVNGATIDTAGNITTDATITGETVAANTSLTVAAKEMSGHTHPQGVDSNGDTQQDTGGPV